MASNMVLATNETKTAHPFYPIEAEIVGYLANDWDVPTLLTYFAAIWITILGATWGTVKRLNADLSTGDQICILWFVLSEWSVRPFGQ
jgi:cholestenol Delta-isomerase